METVISNTNKKDVSRVNEKKEVLPKQNSREMMTSGSNFNSQYFDSPLRKVEVVENKILSRKMKPFFASDDDTWRTWFRSIMNSHNFDQQSDEESRSNSSDSVSSDSSETTLRTSNKSTSCEHDNNSGSKGNTSDNLFHRYRANKSIDKFNISSKDASSAIRHLSSRSTSINGLSKIGNKVSSIRIFFSCADSASSLTSEIKVFQNDAVNKIGNMRKNWIKSNFGCSIEKEEAYSDVVQDAIQLLNLNLKEKGLSSPFRDIEDVSVFSQITLDMHYSAANMFIIIF